MSGRNSDDNRGRGGRGRGRGRQGGRGRGYNQSGQSYQQPSGYYEEPQPQEWPSLGVDQPFYEQPQPQEAPMQHYQPEHQMQEAYPALGEGGYEPPPPGFGTHIEPTQYSQPSPGPVPMKSSPAPSLMDRIPPQEINQQVIATQGRRSLANVPSRPLRPGYGKQGKPIKLLANWFTVDVAASELYQYAVHIKKLVFEETEPGAEDTAAKVRRPARPPRPAAPGPLPSLLCRAAMQVRCSPFFIHSSKININSCLLTHLIH
jgi:hypothetical protein